MNLPTRKISVVDNVKAGQIIRDLRMSRGISLRSFAKLMGYTAPFISDLELGRRTWDLNKFEQAQQILKPQPK